MARKKKTDTVNHAWPRVVVGSHLTVTTYEDGRTELEWDDEALLNDVRTAILSVELPKPRRTKKSKEEIND